MPTLTKAIIEATIAGFEGQKRGIEAQIAELRAMLNGTTPAVEESAPVKSKRTFSAATLKRMREAQQRRWAKVSGTSEPNVATQTAAKPKRKLTAAGKKAIAAAQKKR